MKVYHGEHALAYPKLSFMTCLETFISTIVMVGTMLGRAGMQHPRTPLGAALPMIRYTILNEIY